jgi:hypothetical protein
VKELFSAWRPRDPQDLSALWDKALFVPDANILLHCLRHSDEVREKLLAVFEVLRESLWIPYQIGLEFRRHRLEVEAAALDAYDRLTKEMESHMSRARDSLRQLRAHPAINVEREIAAIEMFESDFRGRIVRAKEAHPSAALASALERVLALFSQRVGTQPAPDRVAAIRKEGEDRYAKRIPPGYKDAKKDAPDSDKYGDLIIWKDLIEKGKTAKRPIIFITDDVKEDWWQIHRGAKIGPRPELLEEFRLHSQQDFHIYELGQFLRIAAERNTSIAVSSIDVIERSVQEDDAARRRIESRALENAAKVFALENERDAIIAALSGVPTASLDWSETNPDKSSLRARLAEVNAELEALVVSESPAR